MIGASLLIIFFCMFVGLLYPALAMFGHNVYSSRNRTISTYIRWRHRGIDIWQGRTLNGILKILAPLVPEQMLSPEYTKKMQNKLIRADLPYTPQEYYLRAVLSASVGVIVIIIALPMKSYLFVVIGILLAVFLFFKYRDEVDDILKDKFEDIEKEIPTFIRSVESALHTSRDVKVAISRYSKIASPAMRSELEALTSDMGSSTPADALRRFDGKMNNPDISRLCSILIEVDKGIIVDTQLTRLAEDMSIMHQELLQRELDKRPGKMKRAILPGGVILVIMMFYILIEAVIQSMGNIL